MGAAHAMALQQWGPEKQLLALIEELAEAQSAAVRLLLGKRATEEEAIIELRTELIDVESLTKSLFTYLGTVEEWEQDRRRKYDKLRAKLGCPPMGPSDDGGRA